MACINACSRPHGADRDNDGAGTLAVTAKDAARDVEGFTAYFHADYLGWSVEDALPVNKATVRRFIEHQMKTTQVLVQNIQPVGIELLGDVAFVHYYWTRIETDAEA